MIIFRVLSRRPSNFTPRRILFADRFPNSAPSWNYFSQATTISADNNKIASGPICHVWTLKEIEKESYLVYCFQSVGRLRVQEREAKYLVHPKYSTSPIKLLINIDIEKWQWRNLLRANCLRVAQNLVERIWRKLEPKQTSFEVKFTAVISLSIYYVYV